MRGMFSHMSFSKSMTYSRPELFSMVLKLHQAGLRHGDLEPQNVLRSSSGQLKLVDLSGASFYCYILYLLFDVRTLNVALYVSRREMYACVCRWAICVRPRGV